jgi:hypothetical protein
MGSGGFGVMFENWRKDRQKFTNYSFPDKNLKITLITWLRRRTAIKSPETKVWAAIMTLRYC